MPILRVARALDESASARGLRAPTGPIMSFCGSKVPQNVWIPCLGRRRTGEKNLTPLSLSSVEKFVTVQTQNKQTNKVAVHTAGRVYSIVQQTNSKRYNTPSLRQSVYTYSILSHHHVCPLIAE